MPQWMRVSQWNCQWHQCLSSLTKMHPLSCGVSLCPVVQPMSCRPGGMSCFHSVVLWNNSVVSCSFIRPLFPELVKAFCHMLVACILEATTQWTGQCIGLLVSVLSSCTLVMLVNALSLMMDSYVGHLNHWSSSCFCCAHDACISPPGHQKSLRAP